MNKCPVLLVVYNPLNRSHVLATFEVVGVVYRRAVRAKNTRPPNYWEPSGEYFVKAGWQHLPVTLVGNGFRLEINARRFHRVFLQHAVRKEKPHG